MKSKVFQAGILCAAIGGITVPAPAHIGLFADYIEQRRDLHLFSEAKAISEWDKQGRAEFLIRQSFEYGARKGARNVGVDTWIPNGTRLDDVQFFEESHLGEGEEIRVQIEFPKGYLESGQLNESGVILMGHEIFGQVLKEDFQIFMLYARDPNTGEFVDIQQLLEEEPVLEWDPGNDTASDEMALAEGKPPRRKLTSVERKGFPQAMPGLAPGALSGKTIYINQSHGWFDHQSFGRWRVQRGNCYGVTEDFDSAEFINLYVLPMLRNAGAKVQTVREMDLQRNMVIVDNEDGTSNPGNGTYVETGSWTTSGINGFRQKTTAAWTGVTVNPFNQGSGANRLAAIVSGAPTRTATWTAVIPADGYYNVYASWTGFSARARDAQYLVHHSGGVSEVRVDQTIDGYTWNLLGNFYFEAGAPADERKVVLTNSSNDASATNVSADAVRWGGGMGDVARWSHGISNRPRWEEEAVNYLQFNGFGYSGTLYNGTGTELPNHDEQGGWADRPQYARWEHSQKDGSVEDALYFAFHTNALSGCPGGVSSAARGLSTFRHSTATAASTTFQTIMHDTMYQAVNTLWVPGWTVRGKNSTNFGENNQSSLGTGLPGFLIEGLFHDNEPDTVMYKDPKFRYDYARAMVRGIIRYYEQRDSITLTLPPEPPRDFRVIMNLNGSATLSWTAPVTGATQPLAGAAAASYRVYTSRNGFGFDDGVPVNGTSVTIPNIPSDRPAYFRVVAVNAGGYSIPTETLAASRGSARVLIVNGFDRNQRSQLPSEVVTNAGTQLRLDPRRFQAFNYVIEHANALAPLDLSISSTSNEPVSSGAVNLANFDAVFWILGEESTLDETFNNNEQTRVSQYLDNPGAALFVTGAEITWDLERSSGASIADTAFLNNILRVQDNGDDAGTYNVITTGALFAGIPAFNFNPASGARYDADFPDRLTPVNGSTAVLSYSGGSGGTAAIAYEGSYRVVLFGFPFETISSPTTRAQIMERVFDFFELASQGEPTSTESWILF